MTDSQTQSPSASSTGQPFTGSVGLDAHFEANRTEYEAAIRSVGIRPGWRVLDAGCGPGGFLPVIADLVGPSGSIAALDLAPENVALAEQRAAEGQVPCPVEARVGTVTALPYPDNAFDAVWSANTMQYLSDEELRVTLGEMRRVVRSGGLVAIKDSEPALHYWVPDQGLLARYREARGRTSAYARQTTRGRGLYRHLRVAGLVDVWQRAILIERFAPFDDLARENWGSAFVYFAQVAAALPDLSETDREAWRVLGNPEHEVNPLNDPDAYLCEGNVLAVGRVP